MKKSPLVVKLVKVLLLDVAMVLSSPLPGAFCHAVNAQDKPGAEVDLLLKEVLAATQAGGDEAVRGWMKTNKGRVRAEWIEHLAQQGADGHGGKLVKIAVLLAEEKGDVRCLADTYLAAGDCDQAGNAASALIFYGKALDLFEKMKDLAGQGKADFGEGMAYSLSGRPQMALQSFNRALTLRRALGDRAGEGETLHKIGNVFYALGEKQKALEYFQQALPIRRAVGDRTGEAKTLSNIGLVFLDLGDPYKAIEAYQQLLAIQQATGDQEGAAEILEGIGDIYSNLGEQRKALDCYNQGLPIFRASGKRAIEAATLQKIGFGHYMLSEWPRALECWTQALPIFRTLGDRVSEARILFNMGLACSNLGEPQKAIEQYNLALPIFRALGDKDGEAKITGSLGVLYFDLGEWQKALESYSQALPIERAIGDRAGEAMQLQNIGNIYYTFGEWRKALKCYNQALPIYQAAGERKGEGQTLINIGNLHYGLGEARKALDYYLRALPILRAARDRTGEAITINNIGSAYFDLGEKQKALAYYLKALSIFRDLGYRVGEAGTLSHIGEAYAGFGKHQKALEYYDQALSIERAIGSQGFEADTDYHMMRAWNALSKPRLAVLYGKRAVALCQELRANIRGLDKETQQAYLKTVEKVYRELANILAGQGRLWEAEQVLGLLKQEEYFEFVRRDAATAKALEERADLTPVERAALGQYEEAAEKVGDIGHRVEELRAIKARTAEQEAELGQLNKELEAASRTFGVVLREIEDELGRGRGARDVVEELRATKGLGVDLRRLGRDIVFLSTVVTEKCVWVILTTPTTQVAGKTDIGEEDLNRKVQAFRSALGDPGSDPVPLAREFYRILIKPVEKELRSASPQTVAWMLDGTLRYLPVAALHDGKRYLVERFGNVVLTPASRSRLELKPSPAWRALGLGVSEAVGGFRALPAVADELRAVVQEGSGESGALPGHRLLNGAFTRQALEEGREAGYQVMHIASHFDFNPGTAADSFLLLGDGSHLTLEDIRTEPEPLFAGVELLALSACETAMGGKQADGREVDGLGEEVQNLGAEAVLATLWPVADESTAELMAGFYRHRQEQRLSKAEALREAQLALLKGRSGATAATQGPRGAIPAEGGRQATAGAPHFAFDPTKPYAHPYFWAPFILIGNWR